MRTLLTFIASSLLIACSHTPKEPIPRAQDVDLDRFMGRWYVIANIPTFIEKGAHNAVETYIRNPDGSIATSFSFNEDSFEGKREVYNPTGFVSEEDNSLWGMQFIWPIKAEYVIAYLSPDYQQTIIARTARDYVWIMARTPGIDDNTYQKLIQICADMGYDTKLIQKVPQQWTSQDTKIEQTQNVLEHPARENQS